MTEKNYIVIDQAANLEGGKRNVRSVVKTRSVQESAKETQPIKQRSADNSDPFSWRSNRFLASNSSLPPSAFIEIAVFVDKDLTEHMKTNFPDDTEKELVRFVLAMVNAVSNYILSALKRIKYYILS